MRIHHFKRYIHWNNEMKPLNELKKYETVEIERKKKDKRRKKKKRENTFSKEIGQKPCKCVYLCEYKQIGKKKTFIVSCSLCCVLVTGDRKCNKNPNNIKKQQQRKERYTASYESTSFKSMQKKSSIDHSNTYKRLMCVCVVRSTIQNEIR